VRIRRCRTRDRAVRLELVLLLAIAILGSFACRSQEQVLADQHKALVSLPETTLAIGEAWLTGSVSGTYARTALESTAELLEQQGGEPWGCSRGRCRDS
jgi:hypothetical protein